MTDHAIRQGLRVLVAEDEALVSMLIEDMLADMGALVVGPAATFDEAMGLAGSETIDIALLDVNLAGKPVFPIADLLRERGIVFIFASGYGEAGIIESHRGAPCCRSPSARPTSPASWQPPPRPSCPRPAPAP